MTATSDIKRRFTASRRSRIGYAVLIALAWFQVAFATHQFEHVTGDLFDVCTVCKQIERQDNAVATPAADTLPVAAAPRPLAAPAGIAPATVDLSYQSRAPPAA